MQHSQSLSVPVLMWMKIKSEKADRHKTRSVNLISHTVIQSDYTATIYIYTKICAKILWLIYKSLWRILSVGDRWSLFCAYIHREPDTVKVIKKRIWEFHKRKGAWEMSSVRNFSAQHVLIYTYIVVAANAKVKWWKEGGSSWSNAQKCYWFLAWYKIMQFHITTANS